MSNVFYRAIYSISTKQLQRPTDRQSHLGQYYNEICWVTYTCFCLKLQKQWRIAFCAGVIDSLLYIQQQSHVVHFVQCCVSVLKKGMYELCIHEPSSVLVNIAQVSCWDFDICIYFKALFSVNMCWCVYVCACACDDVTDSSFHLEKSQLNWNCLSLSSLSLILPLCWVSVPFLCFLLYLRLSSCHGRRTMRQAHKA